MTEKIIGVLAFLMLVAFLGILIVHLPRLDLITVIVITVLLAGWDLVLNLRGNRG